MVFFALLRLYLKVKRIHRISEEDYRRIEDAMDTGLLMFDVNFEQIKAGRCNMDIDKIMLLTGDIIDGVLSDEVVYDSLSVLKRFLVDSQTFGCICSREGVEIFYNGNTFSHYPPRYCDTQMTITYGYGRRAPISKEAKEFIEKQDLRVIELGRVLIPFDTFERNGISIFEEQRAVVCSDFEVPKSGFEVGAKRKFEVPTFGKLLGGQVVFNFYGETVCVEVEEVRNDLTDINVLKDKLPEDIFNIGLGSVHILDIDFDLNLGDGKSNIYKKTSDFANDLLFMVNEDLKKLYGGSKLAEKFGKSLIELDNILEFRDFLVSELSLLDMDETYIRELLTKILNMVQLIIDLMDYQRLHVFYRHSYIMDVMNPSRESTRITGTFGVSMDLFKS